MEMKHFVFYRADGRLYHLGVKAGELSDRILTVGKRCRAESISKHLLTDVETFKSTREFLVFTGKYKGVRVSLVSIGMGCPNMDFFVRESSIAVEGKSMALARLGTCGLFDKEAPSGTAVVSDSCCYVYKNYTHWDGSLNDKGEVVKDADSKPYLISGPVNADPELTNLIVANLEKKEMPFIRGRTTSAETFYSAQGRETPGFTKDENTHVEDMIKKSNIIGCEMESHQLLHLCKYRDAIDNGKPGVTKAAAVQIGIVNRVNPSLSKHLSDDDHTTMALKAAEAILDALVAVKL